VWPLEAKVVDAPFKAKMQQHHHTHVRVRERRERAARFCSRPAASYIRGGSWFTCPRGLCPVPSEL
jgi:hypothetical protein